MGLTVLLHNREELDDDLGRRSDQDLALAFAFGIDNAVESVVLYREVRCQRTLRTKHVPEQLTRTEMRTMLEDYMGDLLGRYR